MAGVFKIKLKLGATVVAASEGARKAGKRKGENRKGTGTDSAHKGKGGRRKADAPSEAQQRRAAGKEAEEGTSGAGGRPAGKKRKRQNEEGTGKGKAPKFSGKAASFPDASLQTGSHDFTNPQEQELPPSSQPPAPKLSVPIRMTGKTKSTKKSKSTSKKGAVQAPQDETGSLPASGFWQDVHPAYSHPASEAQVTDIFPNLTDISPIVAPETLLPAPSKAIRDSPSAKSLGQIAVEPFSTPTSSGKGRLLGEATKVDSPHNVVFGSGSAKSEGKNTSSAGKLAGKPGDNPDAPLRKDLIRIVDKIQNKDEYQIFGEPVTEEMAPGYFDVVSQPMDFTAVRRKIDNSEYGTWEDLSSDLCLMFENAMLYNGPDTIYHQIALSMKNLALKMVELGKQGVQSFRGRTAAIMRAHNAAQRIAVMEALEADAQEPADEGGHAKEGAQAIDFGGNRKGPGRPVGSSSAFRELPAVRPNGEDYRGTYTFLADETPSTNASTPPTIADGATSEGVAFRGGRFVIQHVQLPTQEAYLRSMCRFFPGLGGRARALASSRCPFSF